MAASLLLMHTTVQNPVPQNTTTGRRHWDMGLSRQPHTCSAITKDRENGTEGASDSPWSGS